MARSPEEEKEKDILPVPELTLDQETEILEVLESVEPPEEKFNKIRKIYKGDVRYQLMAAVNIKAAEGSRFAVRIAGKLATLLKDTFK